MFLVFFIIWIHNQILDVFNPKIVVAVSCCCFVLETSTGTNLHDHNVPCAVCKSQRPTALMLPGKNRCYDGWNVEYTGYLVAAHSGHEGKSEFICLDGESEKDESGYRNEDGALMYRAAARCGSLPCPAYEEKRLILCAVCSQ